MTLITIVAREMYISVTTDSRSSHKYTKTAENENYNKIVELKDNQYVTFNGDQLLCEWGVKQLKSIIEFGHDLKTSSEKLKDLIIMEAPYLEQYNNYFQLTLFGLSLKNDIEFHTVKNTYNSSSEIYSAKPRVGDLIYSTFGGDNYKGDLTGTFIKYLDPLAKTGAKFDEVQQMQIFFNDLISKQDPSVNNVPTQIAIHKNCIK